VIEEPPVRSSKEKNHVATPKSALPRLSCFSSVRESPVSPNGVVAERIGLGAVLAPGGGGKNLAADQVSHGGP
jgi:hypothetical protein